MIFISTGGYHQVPAFVAAKQLIMNGFTAIELSGGKYTSDLLMQLKQLKDQTSFRIHNYFPPPENPFVLNLASSNDEIAQAGFKHVVNAMQWAIELDSTVYSFHAGFLFDPQPKELGKPIKKYKLQTRQDGLQRFLEQVNLLAEIANKLGVQLLIENNVVSSMNFQSFGEDPLLMTTPEEALLIMNQTPDNVGLLIDVAHLKVSSHTLGYSPESMLIECEPWTRAYHLSDNDGLQDSNEPINEKSWFWPYINKNLDYYSLEIYHVPEGVLRRQKKLVNQKLG